MVEGYSDEDLMAFHDNMRWELITVEDTSSRAIAMYSRVLKELDRRRLITLISGSYDDVGNMLVMQ